MIKGRRVFGLGHRRYRRWTGSLRLLGTLLALVAALQTTPAEASARVYINELMAANSAALADENGDFPDWFELFNAGDAEANLEGYGITDEFDHPFKWVLHHATLASGGFLTIFASGKDRQPQDVAPLTPVQVPRLRLWLTAETINTNDLGQVRKSGGSIFVKMWRDRSGGLAHAAAASDAVQPLFLPAAVNGLPALRFDGANDQLLLPRVLATNSFTLIVVARTSVPHEVDPEGSAGVGGVSGQRYLFGARHGGDLAAGAGVSMGTNGVSVYEHGSNYMPALAAYAGRVGTGYTLISVRYDSRRPDLFLRGLLARNGALSGRATVTAPVEIGAGAYGAFAGDIAEILLYDRALSETERRGVEAYLATKYSLALPLPRHTNFELSSKGEKLRLTAPDGTPVDTVKFDALPRDVSFGRQPDGSPDLFYFAKPTPGASNNTPGASEFLEAPKFSEEGGFHTEALDLAISTASAGAQIRYTMDGSEPTEASALFVTPLHLTPRTNAPNVFSAIPTTPGGALPSGPVFKGWLIRARAFKGGALSSDVTTRTFFIHPRGRSRYSMPVFSLATAKANFFDPNIGIYVPGNAPGGNYSQRGPEWERPVHVEMYDTDNSLAFAQEAGVKIHGNTSQNFPIKGLDLDGTQFKGTKPFKYPLFPDRARTEFEHFLLRPTGHDQPYAFMRDEFMQELVTELGVEEQASRPCVVFINGEYFGLHYLKEKQDAEFLTANRGVAPDAMDFLEGYAAARVGDTVRWQELVDFLNTHSLASAANYAQVQEFMEVDNYILYKVAESYCYRWDIGNHRFWRPRSPEGRFRWMQFDNDVGWGGFWAEQPAWTFDMLKDVMAATGGLHEHSNEATTFLLRKLLENSSFKRDFVNGFADLMNSVYVPDRAISRINARATVLEPEMAEHIQRWRSPASVTEWKGNVQYLRDFATRRPSYIRQQLMQKFGLAGAATLQLAADPPEGGRFGLSFIEVGGSLEAPWQGRYFTGNPLRLTARPAAGWHFNGWDGIEAATASATITLTDDLLVTARFGRDGVRFTAARSLDDGSIHFEAEGLAAAVYILEASPDLSSWGPVDELTADSQGRLTRDLAAGGLLGAQFYRLRAK